MPPSPPRASWSLTARMRMGLALLFIPVLLLGSIYYLHMARTLRHEQQQNLITRNTQFFHSLLEPYFENLERQFTLIYQQIDYQDFNHPDIRNRERYLQRWQAYQEVIPLNYIYVGTEQRQMLSYPTRPAGDQSDPRTLPWYLLAANNLGQLVWSDPAYDHNLDTLTSALAKVIEDPNGKRVGVLSLNIHLIPIAQWLNHADSHTAEHNDNGYQLLITQDGIQLAPIRGQQQPQQLSHPEWLEQMKEPEGFFLDDAHGMMVAYHQLPQQRWILLSVIPTTNLTQTIHSVSLNVLGMIAIASIFYLLLALRWSRYFSRMLKEISSLIRASFKNDHSPSERRMRELSSIYAEMEMASKEVANVRLQANQDKLTGLFNRRFLDECLQKQVSSDKPFGVAMFDLDNFKRVNDRYGHQAGDVVLKRVSKLGTNLFQDWGWFCRYGGEELVLVFPLEMNMEDITNLLNAFRLAVERLEWREPDLKITVSGGVALSRSELSPKALIELADNGVYQAKREGKNRICFLQHNIAELMEGAQIPPAKHPQQQTNQDDG